MGILGGTFNPPHAGHLALARTAREQLGLDCVLLMPANVAPNKPASGDDPGAQRRLAMCRLAVAAEPAIQASALEIDRGGVSYTVDTLQAIHDEHPDAKLTLILGADTARTLPGWREPGRLLGMADLAVAERDGPAETDIRATLGSLADAPARPAVRVLRMPKVPVSSSQVRELAAAGRPVRELVGVGVAEYIVEHGLYSDPVAVAAPKGETA